MGIETPGHQANYAFGFNVYFPVEFYDTDSLSNTYSFRGVQKHCTADYTMTGDGFEGINMVTHCKDDDEFSGINHKVSHDGVFRVVAREVPQEYLEKVGSIDVVVWGSYIFKGKKKA